MADGTGTMTRALGLYVHVPFCSAICNYCNFNRGLFDAALKERYVEALIAEIAGPEMAEIRHVGADLGRPSGGAGSSPARVAQADTGAPRAAADTIFFGGGTPSLLEPE